MSLSSAKSQSMISINEYISKNETAKPASVAYLTNRCAALYTYISGLIVEKNKKLSDEYLLRAGKMSFEATEVLRAEYGNTLEEATKSSLDTIFKMIEFYKEDAANNYAKTGEYILGGYMEKDTQLCKVIYKKF